ncbi:MAG: hypothetical protein Q8M18_06005 [Bradyrhizobium sp.]|nr:hypothetical protein [Bradyrhizobium sp.]
MLSRALSLATVTLVIGCLAAIPVRAQNLDAGKSPSQIFSSTCTVCHKAPRGLLKTMSPGSLPGFLRQHYTTSGEMASQLSAFLLANGATDTRGSKPAQQAKDARRPAPTQEAARPEAEPQQAAKQDGVAPGPDGRKSAAKQKLSKRGKGGSDEVDAARDEPIKSEATKEDSSKSESAKEAGKETAQETGKETGKETAEEAAKATAKEGVKEAAPEHATKPSGEDKSDSKSDTAKIDPPKENGDTPALRADPVPPVTPAPSMSAAVSSGSLEPPASPEPPLVMLLPPPPALTASGPPLPPVPPAGPPAPPISR